MIAFTPQQRQTLRELAELWKDTTFCLIGASALSCHLDLRRATNDLDISVSVSLDELPISLERLRGWRRHPKKEHEWSSSNATKVDILPTGPRLLAAGEVVWPKSGTRMSLAGLRLALEHGVLVEIEPGLSVKVAPVPVLALLKMVSYLDRPHERTRDLQDLGSMLEDYVRPDNERRFATEVINAGMTYETASAYLLGVDLGSLVNDGERTAVKQFVARLRDDRDPSGMRVIMARLGPASWRREPDELLARIEAFSTGFST